MKKILLFSLLTICLLYFISCRDKTTDSSTNTSDSTNTDSCRDCDTDIMQMEEWKKFTEYKKTYVEAMVYKYFHLPKTNKNVLRMINLENPPARKFLKNQESLNLVVGAYLRDTLEHKAGEMAIIVQLRYKREYKYYDYSEMFPKAAMLIRVCPPPEDEPCPLEPPPNSDN